VRTIEDWPYIKGDYELGTLESSVAILIIGRGLVELPKHRYAIKGTLKTENMGLEKVVLNIISNPRIRFIIVCGKEEFGHFPANAIQCLWSNGVDDRKRIVGARSAIPYLCNITVGSVERFRRQVELIDLVDPKDTDEIVAYDPLYKFDEAMTENLLMKVEECEARVLAPFDESPMILTPPALMVDAKKAVRAIDTLAIEFTNQMLRLPSEKLSTEASLISISEPLGIVFDPIDGKVFEVPSVEFASKLKSYYRGGT
jgi:tetrahydromethanopterin S-methyltransferase subunit A